MATSWTAFGRLLPLWLAVVALCGCRGNGELTVASKRNTENQILAEMMALAAKQEGIPVRRRIPYGNTFDIQEAIKSGTVDLYPEYTGTGLSMMGVPPIADADEAQARVRELFQPFGLRWLPRMGVDNSYVLVVRPAYAARHDVEQISRLALVPDEIRFATGKEFADRVVDGMPALLRRYGISNAQTAVTTDDKEQLYDALLRKEADVAVGYATDGRIEEFGLVILEDDHNLFAPYEAAPLVREDAIARFPQLQALGDKLAQVLTNAKVRELNKRVELNGADPEVVAGEFLVDAGIIEPAASKKALKKLTVAIPPSTSRERFSPLNGRALAALRRTNAGRRHELKHFADPMAALVAGDAFVAIVGAEFFFESDPAAPLPRLVAQVEAVAPVGFRMLHIIGKPDRLDAARSVFEQAQRIGVGREHGAAHRLASFLADAYSAVDQPELVFGEAEALLQQLDEGALDGVLSFIKPGAPQITLTVQDGDRVLYPLPGWGENDREFRYPFIRAARIPAKTYPGIDRPLETVSTQVVIVGPGALGKHIGTHGPGDALDEARKPLPLSLKKKLNGALSGPKMIDPTLPGESVGVGSKPAEIAALNPAPEISVLTAFVLLLLSYVFVEVFRKHDPVDGSGSSSESASD